MAKLFLKQLKKTCWRIRRQKCNDLVLKITSRQEKGTEQSISDAEVAIEEMEGLIAKLTEGMRMIERKCWPGAVQKDVAEI